MPTLTTQEEIAALTKRLETLTDEAEMEVRRKLAEARKVVEDLEAQLSDVTGRPSASQIAADKGVKTRKRRPKVSDEDLSKAILETMAAHGKEGMNAKTIAEKVGHPPIVIRKFLTENPKALKRQGKGPGTKFFLP